MTTTYAEHLQTIRTTLGMGHAEANGLVAELAENYRAEHSAVIIFSMYDAARMLAEVLSNGTAINDEDRRYVKEWLQRDA